MGVRLPDVTEAMGDFPVAYAKDIECADGERLQEKIDTGSLGGGGTGYKQLSQAEYDALTDDEKMNGKEYRTYDTGHIYKNGVEYGKDFTQNIQTYSKPSQLGLSDTACTTVELVQAMRNALNGTDKSGIGVFNNGNKTITDAPTPYGLVHIEIYGHDRIIIRYDGISGSTFVGSWIGKIKGNNGTFSGIDWEETSNGLVTYTALNDLNARKGLSISLVAGEDNTQKIIDALEPREQFIDWFGNSTSNNRFGIDTKTYGDRINELRIVKMTATDATVIAIMDSGITLSRVYTSSALGAWCVKKENSTGLVTNAQNFKIDLTKNNASWYGMFTFNFVYGTMPCEITVTITDKVYYTITKGQNVVSAITYTQDGAKYTIGIDFTTKMYGTQVVEMPSEFGTINSLTAETFAGTTTAILKGYGGRTYTKLAELGLTADVTLDDVIYKMDGGQSANLSTMDFTNYKTLFPYSEEQDAYAIVTIEKSFDTSRTIVKWVRKDASKVAYGGLNNNNKVTWWREYANKNEILYTSLSGNLASITTVLDLVNALLTEYRALSQKKPVRFVSGEISKTTLTDLPVTYGVLQITVAGWDVVEVRLAHSANGFKSMYYGFLTRITGQELISSITWEKVATTDYVDSKTVTSKLSNQGVNATVVTIPVKKKVVLIVVQSGTGKLKTSIADGTVYFNGTTWTSDKSILSAGSAIVITNGNVAETTISMTGNSGSEQFLIFGPM